MAVGNTPEEDTELLEAAKCMGLDISEHLQNQANAPAVTEIVCEVWPDHWDALRLYQACRGQLEISLGGMGGVHYMAARSANVQAEVVWLGIARKAHASTVALYRQIEAAAVTRLNQQANKEAA